MKQHFCIYSLAPGLMAVGEKTGHWFEAHVPEDSVLALQGGHSLLRY